MGARQHEISNIFTRVTRIMTAIVPTRLYIQFKLKKNIASNTLQALPAVKTNKNLI